MNNRKKLAFEDFKKGEGFVWKTPRNHYDQVGSLPIYIGHGVHDPFKYYIDEPTHPPKEKSKQESTIAIAAINFVYGTLMPLQVSNIVAIDDSRAWAAASYLGAYGWEDNAGFKSFFKPSGIDNLKWLQYPCSDGNIITIISKRRGDLFHWQFLNGKNVCYSAYVLFLDVQDATAVKLYKNKENMQILHDMTYEAAIKPSDQKVLFNHCKEGIGRSAIIMLAEVMLVSSYLDQDKLQTILNSTSDKKTYQHFLPSIAEIEEKSYPERLVKWAHQVRRGMLGGSSGGCEPHMQQIEDCWETGKHLIALPQHTKRSQSVKDRVMITGDERQHILSLPTKAKQFFSELIKKAGIQKVASSTLFASYVAKKSQFKAFKDRLEEKSNSPDVDVYIDIDTQKAMFNNIIQKGFQHGNDQAIFEYLKSASWEGVEQLRNQIQSKLSKDIKELSSLQEILSLHLVEKRASCSIL